MSNDNKLIINFLDQIVSKDLNDMSDGVASLLSEVKINEFLNINNLSGYTINIKDSKNDYTVKVDVYFKPTIVKDTNKEIVADNIFIKSEIIANKTPNEQVLLLEKHLSNDITLDLFKTIYLNQQAALIKESKNIIPTWLHLLLKMYVDSYINTI